MSHNPQLHVPMSIELQSKLRERAIELGFDSPQAYIRFWATAETAAPSDRSYLELHKRQAVRYFELILTLRPNDFPTVGHAVDYVLRELYNTKMRHYLRKVLDNRAKI